jgi:hypothetical protein
MFQLFTASAAFNKNVAHINSYIRDKYMISASVEVLDQDLEAPVTRDDVVLPEERGRLLQHT